MNRLSAAVLLLLIGIVSASCTAMSPLIVAPSRTHSIAPHPTGTPSTPSTPPSQGVVRPPSVNDGPCKGTPYQIPADDGEVEQLGGMTLLTPLDTGPRPFATGIPTLDANGMPVAYEVAANDSFEAISTRFCVSQIWLYWVNAVRRDGETLYAGDTLNLDAHTIFTVGDQNGFVRDNPLPAGFTIPPQR